MKKKDKRKRNIRKPVNDTYYLNVYDMKVECKENDEECYDFNSFRDELVDDYNANVYPLNDGDVMCIEGVDLKTIKKIAKGYDMNINRYISKDNNIDDAVDNYRNPNDMMNEDDIPSYEEVEVEEFPSYDSVDIDDKEYDDYCGGSREQMCLDLVSEEYDKGVYDFGQFEANLDDYVADILGVDVDELDNVPEDTIEDVRNCLINAWQRHEDAYNEDNYDYDYDVNEKRRNRCCPKHYLNEKFYAREEKYQDELDNIEKRVKKTYSDIKDMPISVHEAREALAKLKKENARLAKIENRDGKYYNVMDVAGSKAAFNKLKNTDPEKKKDIDKFQSKLVEKVKVCLKEGKKSLHENVKVNGKAFKDMKLKELSEIYKRNKKSEQELYEAQLSNPNFDEREEIRNKREKKLLLLEYLDQEMTYRYARTKCMKRLFEDEESGATISDEELENLFGPAQGEDSEKTNDDVKTNDDKTSDNDEDVKEIEVDVIKIEMVNNDAAEELKQSCVDAGIPEDEIEIRAIEDEDEKKEDEEETDENKSDENENENNENDTEENNEEKQSDEETNESYLGYNIRKLLFEDEEMSDENNSDENNDSNDDGEKNDDENSDENSDEEEKTEDEPHVMFVLTNQKYIPQLINVLDDQYGINKEEFEEMIGGEIVDKEDDEDVTENEDKEKEKEDGDEKKEDNKEDEIDPNDLFKGL